jgi:hypothetical protein
MEEDLQKKRGKEDDLNKKGRQSKKKLKTTSKKMKEDDLKINFLKQ